MSQLSRERERKRGAKRRAKSKITPVFCMVLIFHISNISSVSNRYSGYIGNQMLFGWVTQVALSLGIHLAVAGGSRPTLSFLGPSLSHGCKSERHLRKKMNPTADSHTPGGHRPSELEALKKNPRSLEVRHSPPSRRPHGATRAIVKSSRVYTPTTQNPNTPTHKNGGAR